MENSDDHWDVHFLKWNQTQFQDLLSSPEKVVLGKHHQAVSITKHLHDSGVKVLL